MSNKFNTLLNQVSGIYERHTNAVLTEVVQFTTELLKENGIKKPKTHPSLRSVNALVFSELMKVEEQLSDEIGTDIVEFLNNNPDKIPAENKKQLLNNSANKAKKFNDDLKQRLLERIKTELLPRVLEFEKKIADSKGDNEKIAKLLHASYNKGYTKSADKLLEFINGNCQENAETKKTIGKIIKEEKKRVKEQAKYSLVSIIDTYIEPFRTFESYSEKELGNLFTLCYDKGIEYGNLTTDSIIARIQNEILN